MTAPFDKEIEAIAKDIGDAKFQIKDIPFPFSLLWFQIDGVSCGRFTLKIVDAPE